MRFEQAVEQILYSEGGYDNDPRDNGGETKFGICKREYPELDIKNLTREQAIAIYKRDYWDRVRADYLPAEIRLNMFDCAVNQGVPTAAKFLQRLVGTTMDGHIGPKTLAAVSRYGDLQSLNKGLFVERALRYAKLDDFHVYGRGWFRRLFDVAEKSQAS